jgi:hypothetical protein
MASSSAKNSRYLGVVVAFQSGSPFRDHEPAALSRSSAEDSHADARQRVRPGDQHDYASREHWIAERPQDHGNEQHQPVCRYQ